MLWEGKRHDNNGTGGALHLELGSGNNEESYAFLSSNYLPSPVSRTLHDQCPWMFPGVSCGEHCSSLILQEGMRRHRGGKWLVQAHLACAQQSQEKRPGVHEEGRAQTEGRGRVTCYGVKGSRLEEGAQLACVWQDGIQTFLEGKGMCRAGEIVRGRDRWEMVPERQLLSVHIVILQMPLKGAIDHVVRRCLYVAVKCRSHGHCSLGRWNESSRMWWVPVWVESGGFWGLLKEANLEQSLRTSLFCSKLVYALTISIWRQPSTSFS